MEKISLPFTHTVTAMADRSYTVLRGLMRLEEDAP